ncbi:MAG TPA: DsbA family protein [Xanthomonadales bacterium]|nr:DsbA family protein [Xanthomonadales bacterium]
MSLATLFYIHDPMCSWCWAYRPVHDELKSKLPTSVSWKNLLGGLAPDNDQLMPDETRTMVMSHWRNIQQKLGTRFNFDFWERCSPRRSTYPACRAVLAAARFNAEEEMTDAIQRAYYLRAMNPSDDATNVELAGELGLPAESFAEILGSKEIHQGLLNEISAARSLGVSSFPSLVLLQDKSAMRIPHDYHSTEPTMRAISSLIDTNKN